MSTIIIPATGSGTATPPVATDDAGASGHVQIVKLAISTAASATAIPADAANGLDVDVTRLPVGQAAMAASTPVVIASNQSTYPVTARQSDGTNNLTTLIDADSGAGTQYVLPISMRKAASGGSVEYGTSSDPIRIDPTGTTTQPVTANAGTNLNTSLLALESGGNLATVAGAVRAEDAASADAHTGIGALAVRKATPANTSGLDGDYEFLQMSAGRLWASATIDAALPAGANAIGKLAANDGVDIGDVTINNGAGASAVPVQDGGNSLTVDGTVTANQGGAPWSQNVTQWGSAATSLGQKVAASSVPVVLASDQSVIPVSDNSGSLTVDNPILSIVGGGTEAAAQRVTIASDSTGVLSVDDNGGSLTVDGSVTVSGTTTTQDAADGLKDVAVPTYITQVGGSDGAYLRPLRISPVGNLKVEIEKMPALDLEGAENLTVNVSPGDEKFTIQGASNAIPVPVSLVPNVLPGYGWLPQAFYAITTTVQTLKPSGGEIGWYYIDNPNASLAYVQFFDTAGNVTLGTDRPKLSIGIPASSAANAPIPSGLSFMYGIRMACTTTATGNTAPGSGLNLNFGYK